MRPKRKAETHLDDEPSVAPRAPPAPPSGSVSEQVALAALPVSDEDEDALSEASTTTAAQSPAPSPLALQSCEERRRLEEERRRLTLEEYHVKVNAVITACAKAANAEDIRRAANDACKFVSSTSQRAGMDAPHLRNYLDEQQQQAVWRGCSRMSRFDAAGPSPLDLRHPWRPGAVRVGKEPYQRPPASFFSPTADWRTDLLIAPLMFR